MGIVGNIRSPVRYFIVSARENIFVIRGIHPTQDTMVIIIIPVSKINEHFLTLTLRYIGEDYQNKDVFLQMTQRSSNDYGTSWDGKKNPQNCHLKHLRSSERNCSRLYRLRYFLLSSYNVLSLFSIFTLLQRCNK
jgi:hypothetical protein